MRDSLTANWTRLAAMMLRRDAVVLPASVLSVWLFCAGFVPALPAVAGTDAELAQLGEMMASPAMVAMCGVLYGGAPNLGIVYTQMMLVWSGLLVAVMNVLIVVRHTRDDEDAGRLELLRSLPAGRLAPLVAVAAIMIGADALLALLIGASMAAFGVASVGLGGSLVYGAALGAAGWLFAAIALLLAQVAQARAVTGWSLGIMGVFFLLRAYGDVSAEWASRLSPFGLIQRTYPFYADRWWPVLVLLGLAVVLAGLALALGVRRDLGEACHWGWRRSRATADRPVQEKGAAVGSRTRGDRAAGDGRAGAGGGHSPWWPAWDLAWRLTRGPVIAWAVAIVALPAGYGSVMGQMEAFARTNLVYQAMTGIDGAGDVVGPTVGMLALTMGILAVIPVLTTVHKLAAEETQGRLDQVLGRAVSRTRVFVGYAVIGLGVAVAAQLLTAAGFWVAAAAVMDDPVSWLFVLKATFNDGAALVAFAGLGLCLVGWAKRATWISWAYLTVTFLVVYMGGLVNLPRWAGRLTPFGLVQRWPDEPFSWWPWCGLVLGGVALAVAGARGYRRRDITA